jgi:cell division protein FtsW
VLLVLIEPDFGTAFHIFIVALILLFFTSFSPMVIFGLMVLMLPVVIYAVINAPYRRDRILAFFDPHTYRFEEGFQIIASYRSFRSGGLWGKGLGATLDRHNLQARHTDFIFSIAAEDMGFIGIVAILTLIFAFCLYALYVMARIEDDFGRILGTGIIIMYITQVIINVSVTMVIIPTTGINLPFFSNGGTSLFFYLLSFGILLNITRQQYAENKI